MKLNWKEEVETIFQDLDRLYLTEDEARLQLNEAQERIPEDELEDVYSAFDLLCGEVEEKLWCIEADAAWEAYEGEDKEGLN